MDKFGQPVGARSRARAGEVSALALGFALSHPLAAGDALALRLPGFTFAGEAFRDNHTSLALGGKSAAAFV